MGSPIYKTAWIWKSSLMLNIYDAFSIWIVLWQQPILTYQNLSLCIMIKTLFKFCAKIRQYVDEFSSNRQHVFLTKIQDQFFIADPWWVPVAGELVAVVDRCIWVTSFHQGVVSARLPDHPQPGHYQWPAAATVPETRTHTALKYQSNTGQYMPDHLLWFWLKPGPRWTVLRPLTDPTV